MSRGVLVRHQKPSIFLPVKSMETDVTWPLLAVSRGVLDPTVPVAGADTQSNQCYAE